MIGFDDKQFDPVSLFRIFLIAFFTVSLFLLVNQYLETTESSNAIMDVAVMLLELYYRYLLLLVLAITIYYIALLFRIKIFLAIASMLKLLAHMLVLHISVGSAYILFDHQFQPSATEVKFPYVPDLYEIWNKTKLSADIEVVASISAVLLTVIICFVLNWMDKRPVPFEKLRRATTKKDALHRPRIFYDEPLTARIDVLDPIHGEAERILRYIDYTYSPDTHLKLAVTAPWGFGKSTMINYIESKSSAPTVKISITLGDTNESIVTHFYDELYEIFERYHIKPDQTLYQYMESVLWIVAQYSDKSVPDMHSGSHNAYSESKERLNYQILKLLKDEKKEYLLIIIDDIDRICHSELDTKKVFTFINELLSFKNCVSIYSFAPSKEMQLQNPYLDKYINRNFNLEHLKPTDEQMNRYLDRLFEGFDGLAEEGEKEGSSTVLYTIKNQYCNFCRRIIDEMPASVKKEEMEAWLGNPEGGDFIDRIPEALGRSYYNFRKIKAFMSEASFVLRPARAVERNASQPEAEIEQAYHIFVIVFMCLIFNEEIRIVCRDMDIMKRLLYSEHDIIVEVLRPYFDRLTPASKKLLNPPDPAAEEG